jgi:hypothetical protein
MTDNDNTGGPAYPPHHDPKDHPSGMTLRDWFAWQALAMVMMRFHHDCDPSPDDIAMQAYFIADAMIAERQGEH